MSSALPSTIPLRREPEALPSTTLQEGAWLGVFVVLVFLAIVVWRKSQAARDASVTKEQGEATWVQWLNGIKRKREPVDTKLVTSTRLTPQHTVHEVTWQGRRLLLGCAPQSITVLAEMPLNDLTDGSSTAIAPDKGSSQ